MGIKFYSISQSICSVAQFPQQRNGITNGNIYKFAVNSFNQLHEFGHLIRKECHIQVAVTLQAFRHNVLYRTKYNEK